VVRIVSFKNRNPQSARKRSERIAQPHPRLVIEFS